MYLLLIVYELLTERDIVSTLIGYDFTFEMDPKNGMGRNFDTNGQRTGELTKAQSQILAWLRNLGALVDKCSLTSDLLVVMIQWTSCYWPFHLSTVEESFKSKRGKMSYHRKMSINFLISMILKWCARWSYNKLVSSVRSLCKYPSI